jgi:ribosomal protein S18 acetylase RimI-like enzyme
MRPILNGQHVTSCIGPRTQRFCTEANGTMATTSYGPETERVWTTRLAPSAWQDYRTLRLLALRTDPHAFEASLEAQRALPDTWWQDRLREAVDGRREWLLFAEQEQRLVGMIGARVSDVPLVADINGVFVTPEARGRGIGDALIRAMLHDLGQDPSIQLVRLYVNVSQVAARRLYERAGFRVVASERSPYGDGNAYDEYLMERANEPEWRRTARVA